MKISKAQILHVLAGVVFVPAASVLSGWLTRHFPGMPNFTPDQILKEELAVAGAGFGLALHYLHGWQVWERDIEPILQITDEPANPGTIPPDGKDGPSVSRATVPS